MLRSKIFLPVAALLLGAACSDSSGPPTPVAIVVRDSTVLLGLDFIASEGNTVEASCGGNPAINCLGGNPGNPIRLTITRTAASTARRTGPDSLIFDWAADLVVVSPAIPINITSIGNCILTIDTRADADSVHVTGTATFTRTRPDGPIDRLDITGQNVTGLTNADVTIGTSILCEVASFGISFYLDLLTDQIFHDYALCGAPGAATFMFCREP